MIKANHAAVSIYQEPQSSCINAITIVLTSCVLTNDTYMIQAYAYLLLSGSKQLHDNHVHHISKCSSQDVNFSTILFEKSQTFISNQFTRETINSCTHTYIILHYKSYNLQ